MIEEVAVIEKKEFDQFKDLAYFGKP